MVALAQVHGLTAAEALALHGGWPAFAHWAMQQTRPTQVVDDGRSAAERYQAMLASL